MRQRTIQSYIFRVVNIKLYHREQNKTCSILVFFSYVYSHFCAITVATTLRSITANEQLFKCELTNCKMDIMHAIVVFYSLFSIC